MSTANIMVVEDEHIACLAAKSSLQRAGYNVPAVASTGEDAIRIAGKVKPDLILMDIYMPEGEIDGIEAARVIRERFNIPVIYFTSFVDTVTRERVKETEPYGYLIKPFKAKELLKAIKIALNKIEKEDVKFKNGAL